MAKSKKFDAPEAPVQQPVEATVVTNDSAATDAPVAQGNPQFVKKPGIFLQDADGVQYKFDRRELPKKAAVVGSIIVDGVETPFQVTSNKGWTPEANVIEYIWITLGINEDRIQGYITLDYLVPAASFVGKEFTVGEGEASRPNPARIPKSLEAEEKRKSAARETLAKKAALKAEQEAAAKDGAQTEQVEGEQVEQTEGEAQPS